MQILSASLKVFFQQDFNCCEPGYYNFYIVPSPRYSRPSIQISGFPFSYFFVCLVTPPDFLLFIIFLDFLNFLSDFDHLTPEHKNSLTAEREKDADSNT